MEPTTPTLAEMMTANLDAVATTTAIIAQLAMHGQRRCQCPACTVKTAMRTDMLRCLTGAIEGLADRTEDQALALIDAAQHRIQAQFPGQPATTIGEVIRANVPALITTAALLTTTVTVMTQNDDAVDDPRELLEVIAGSIFAATQITQACRDVAGLSPADLRARLTAEAQRLTAPIPPTVA